MPFKERTRQFWINVNDGKCAYEQYTEKKGFQECGDKARHVHHAEGEREQLMRGDDPEHSIGVPLCEPHHVRNTGEDLGEPDSSFHPDMGFAYRSYKEWKANEEHMKSITGRRLTNYGTSPFAETAKEHGKIARDGQRYINGDWATDEHYKQKMTDKATKYLAEHPEEKKPNTKPHPETDPTKKEKKWYQW